MGSRSLPEDSVVASLGQIQDMIRDDVRPRRPNVVKKIRAVAHAVPEELIGGVPSAEEIYTRRNARWKEDRCSVTLVPVVRRERRWGRLALGLGTALAFGAGWFLSTASHTPGPEDGPVARAAERAVHIGTLAVASRRVDEAALAADTSNAKAHRLAVENARLTKMLTTQRIRSDAAAAASSDGAATKPSGPSKRARAGRTHGRRRSARRTKHRRRPRRMTRTDKNLSSLIDGL